MGLIAQAGGTYMLGVNQLEKLLTAVETEEGNPLEGLSKALQYDGNGIIKGDQSNWLIDETDKVPLFHFVWAAESYTGYYPSGDNKYRALTAINWADKHYVQKSDKAINLNQNDMADPTDDANDVVNEKNDLSQLATIDFSGNNMREISLDGLGALTTVNLSNNPTLESLSISNCALLEEVDITNSGLTLSTIYAILQTVDPVSVLKYVPQGTIELEFPADKVDLSADVLLGETASTIVWLTDPIVNENGIFVFDSSLEGSVVTAEVSNSELGSEVFTYQITLTESIGDTQRYKMTSKVNNGNFGSISPVDKGKLYKEGSQITYTLTPKVDCEILKLTVNGVDKTAEVINGVYTVTDLSEDLTIIASFRPAGQNYYLTMPPLPYPEMPGITNIPFTKALFEPATHTVSHFPVQIEDAAKFMTVRPGNNIDEMAISTNPEVAGAGKWHVIGFDICLLDGPNTLKPGYYDFTYEWNDQDSTYWIKDTYVSLFPFTVNVNVSAIGWEGAVSVYVKGDTERSYPMTPLKYPGWYAYTFENEPAWIDIYFTHGDAAIPGSDILSQVYKDTCVAITADRTIVAVDCPNDGVAINAPKLSKVTVYPNPTDGQLWIKTEKMVAISIYDTAGRLIETGFSNSEIDISAYRPGLYLLKVENEYIKIIKK
ncbi:hypothetical protein AGMMS50262_22140 [Bacteroidia bacterium]|nr:hypothetical protein AGMMS50262_22140 [Bacteroidia bacterium]